jgi:hypothetical protein
VKLNPLLLGRNTKYNYLRIKLSGKYLEIKRIKQEIDLYIASGISERSPSTVRKRKCTGNTRKA